MIITKMALPRRTFLRGMGATLALPLLDAMVPALSAPRERRPHRSAASGSSTRRTARRWPPGRRRRGAGARRAVADAGAAGAVPRSGRRADRPQPAAGRIAGRRQRRAFARADRVAERASIRSAPKAPTSQAGIDRRSDRRPGARQGHAAAVARDGARTELPGRQLRQRLQLRLLEHDVLAHADHAAADGSQSARRVRADVRRRRQRRRSGSAQMREDRSILDSVKDAMSGLQQRLGRGRPTR